ncbi:MAG: hypothetical protein IH624_17805 [Phycisphaerae bacterium]|nr:hypothetical protein [Phycisphaerae bacterium]
MKACPTIATFIGVLLAHWMCFGNAAAQNRYAHWGRGPSGDETYFPIAVWLQSPARALQYKAAGINTYVGLWQGPTESQLAQLKGADMKVICAQNRVGLAHLDDETIIGWMHGDEPDNAQPLGTGRGYGPPVAPDKIIADYQRIKANDPSRPILLNLGQGVAWDGWHGRGVRTNHPEDYAEYVKGCDIASFDIYPAAHDRPQVAGKLWYVARGVERLVEWSGPDRIVWNCIECTRINHPANKATPHQVRAEVWMSIIHGSTGLIYFVHEWQPRFNESAVLSDPEMLAEITAVNRQIAELAPVLNSPTIQGGVTVTSSHPDVPVAAMVKRHKGAVYVFAVGMRDGATKATFTVEGLGGDSTVTVLGEQRELPSSKGVFEDAFKPWDVHLYKVTAP